MLARRTVGVALARQTSLISRFFLIALDKVSLTNVRYVMSGDLNNVISTCMQTVFGAWLSLIWLRPYVIASMQKLTHCKTVHALKARVRPPVRDLSNETNFNKRDATRRIARSHGRWPEAL